MDQISNEYDNECSTSQLDTEKTMSSASSPQQHLANLTTPGEIDQTLLNSPTTSVLSVITVNDSDEENHSSNDEDDVVVISSDDEEDAEVKENLKISNSYNRRIKYRVQRAINIILKHYRHKLTPREVSYFKEKRGNLKCRRQNNLMVEKVADQTQRTISSDQLLRRIQTLRRRYYEAIRISQEFMSIWCSEELNDPSNQMSEYMRRVNTTILKDKNVQVTRGPDGEINSNELDTIIKNIEESDTESSSASEISSTYSESDRNHSSPKTNYDSEPRQYRSLKPYHAMHTPFCNKNENSLRGISLRYQRYKQRLQRRQQLRNRFKITHRQFYNNDSSGTSQTKNFVVEKEISNNKDGIQNSIINDNVNVNNTIEVIQIDSDSEPSDCSSIELYSDEQNEERLRDTNCRTQLENDNGRRPHENIDGRKIALSVAAMAKGLSSTHIEIFHGIKRMADCLYKITVEPIAGPAEETRPEKENISADDKWNVNVGIGEKFFTNNIQQTVESLANLILKSGSCDYPESSVSTLLNSINAQVLLMENLANKIVSGQIITTQLPSCAFTSTNQISKIESLDKLRICLNSGRLFDDDKPSQQEPDSSNGSVDVCKSELPSSPIIVITPPPDVPESCIIEELPCRHNGRRVVETKSLSSKAATPSHAISDNLLAPPVMRVQRRSRNRIHDQRRPRRFCSPSSSNSGARIISLEETGRRSTSPLPGPRSPTLPLVPSSSLHPSSRLLGSSPTTTIDINGSTAATTVETAELSNLSPSPPEALKSTLQTASIDDGATVTLSQTALALLELSGQLPKYEDVVNVCIIDNRPLQTAATSTTETSAAATAAVDDSMSNSDVLTTIAVSGGGLARNPATKRQRSRDRSDSPSNARKLKPSTSSDTEQQPNKE